MREGTLEEITPSSVRKTCKGIFPGERVGEMERKSQFTYSPQRVRLSAFLVSDSPQFPGHRGEAEVLFTGRCSVMSLPLTN